jgi:molybdate transport system substrate-binding protein
VENVPADEGKMMRLVAALCAVFLVTSAGAAELKVLTPGALLSSFKALNPQFESATGQTVTVTLTPALAVPRRIENGDGFDLAIMGERAASELETRGLLTGKTRIARSGVGVFVRRGDPKPDVSTAEAFTRALLEAKVIVYSDPALGGSASTYVNELIARLDTTGAIRPKIRLAKEYRSIANTVAAGGVDLALNQVTEIMADARLELVGPLPASLQRYTSYTAGVVTASQHAEAARALIAFWSSEKAAEVMRRNGFEPR